MAVRTKQDATVVLSEISGDNRFFCNDGCIISNLPQLAECLSHMNEHTFEHHTRHDNNDFSNWIAHVLSDEKLARDITGTANHHEAAEIVRRRVVWLQEKIGKQKRK